MDIFSLLLPKFKIDNNKPLRLITLFSGYDSQKLGFDYLNIPVEHYRAIEFDKYAIQSLNEIHGTNFTTNDITQINADDLGIVDTDKITYLLTYSFPCTDLSNAGKKAGMEKGSGTRSGLLWEVERLLKESKEKCQVLIMENVPQVLSSKGWREWLLFLESLGYSNYAEVLNAKDYGIPQNRKRCFMVSILGDYSYEFPKKIPLEIRLKDILEDEIDEKYYLSKQILNFFKENSINNEQKGNGFRFTPITRQESKIAKCITTRNGQRMDDNFIIEDLCHKSLRETLETNKIESYDYIDAYNRTIKSDGISGTITTRIDAGNNTFVCVPESTMKQKLCNALIENEIVQENYVINHSYTNGLNGKNPNSRQTLEDYIESTDNISPCLTTRSDTLGVVVKDTPNYIEWEQKGRLNIDCRDWKENTIAPKTVTTNKTKVLLNDLRIRKLTPCECFKLMGVKPSDYVKITCSNAQKYKQAGNSIVTTVLMAIYSQLFDDVDYKYHIDKLIEDLRSN